MDEVHSLKGLTMKDLIRHAAELKQQVAAFKQSETALRLVYEQLEIQVYEHSNMERLNQTLDQAMLKQVRILQEVRKTSFKSNRAVK